jgi:two-component system chemotaxis sensor kinase CheA
MDIDREALIEAFITEADELLTEIEAALLHLESGEGGRDEREVLLRAVHTMKGNASCVSYDELTDYIHRFEDVLAGGDMRAESVTQLLRVVDVIRTASVNGGVLPVGAEEALAGGERTSRPIIEKRADETSAPLNQSIRVATEKLDRMVDLAGELAIARGRVGKVLADHADLARSELVEAIADADRLDLEMQELVMGLRMMPVGPDLQRFARIVRDLAGSHGKVVQLTVEGGDVEIDNAVIAALRDPLTHMVRNAIDHGIETPDARELAGKPRMGRITIRARHSGGRIIVDVEDDGAGLDLPRIVEHAAAAGLIDAGASLDEHAAAELIFTHGFSTIDEASDLSGRGIGMDVVRRGVEALRGTVEVESAAGNGTRFIITLPLTLAIIDGFALGVGDDTFIVPLDSVVECLDLPPGSDHERLEGLINVRGEALPFIRLRRHLRLAAPRHAVTRESVIIVAHANRRIGLCSDRLIGQIQTVIKPIGVLDRVPCVSSAAILGSGDVALILDVPQLIQSATSSRLTTSQRRAKRSIHVS